MKSECHVVKECCVDVGKLESGVSSRDVVRLTGIICVMLLLEHLVLEIAPTERNIDKQYLSFYYYNLKLD